MQPVIKLLKMLAAAKQELSLSDLADKTGYKKVMVKTIVKSSPYFQLVEVEPFGKKKAVIFVSVSDVGIEFLTRWNRQNARVCVKPKPMF